MKLNRAEMTVLLVTVGYAAGFFVYFAAAGNYEFIWYVVTLLVIGVLIVWAHRGAPFPPAMLWALSAWGLAHMAGGGVDIDGEVLYKLVLIPLAGSGELTLLKYDQVVHFYGFAVTAWVLWHLLNAHFPALRGTRTLYVYPALGSMGLGALNEIIEFAAVVILTSTNVGGYFNTALDLVFNALGAIAAMALAAAVKGRESGPVDPA